MKTQKNLRMIILFFEPFHLSGGQGTKIRLIDSADKKRPEQTAIPARNASIKFHAQKNTFVIANKGDFLWIRVDCSNQAANGILHFMQPVDLLLVWSCSRFRN